MSTENTTNTPASTTTLNEPAATAAPATTGATTPVEPPAAPAATQPGDKPLTQADIDAAVKKAQKEWEKKVQDAEAKAKLSDDERLKLENTELKRTIQMGKAETEVTKALEKAGAKAPLLLFNVKKGELQFDDSGKITNLTEIVDELKSEYSDQFGVEKPSQSIDAGAGTTTSGQPLTKAIIEKMSHKEIMEREKEITEFLSKL